ncbi:MAG: TolC family protein [Cytophagaceae bacterium]
MCRTKFYSTFFLLIFSSLAVFAQDVWNLQECIEHAHKNNLAVNRGFLETESAAVRSRAAKNNYLPEVFGTGRNLYNWGLFVDPATNILVDRSVETYMGAVQGELVLFNGGYNYNFIKQTTEEYNASFADLKARRNEITLLTMTAYYQLLLAKEQLSIAQRLREQSERQYVQIKGLVEGGVLHRRELINAEADLAFREVEIVNAENTKRRSNLMLRQTMGIMENVEMAIVDENELEISLIPDEEDFAELCENARAFLPQITAAKHRAAAAQYELKIMQSIRYPRLSLNGGVITRSTSLLEVEQSDQFRRNVSKFVAFNLFIPIFSRFNNLNDISLSRINAQIRENELQEINLEIEKEIQQAYLDVNAAHKRYHAVNKQLEALRQQNDFAERSYLAGVINFTEFNNISIQYSNAQIQVVQARYDFYLRKQILEFYKGNSICER